MNAANTVSAEIDLDLPRGYVAKIKTAMMEFRRVGEDFEGISADKLARLQAALVLDPDDAANFTVPTNVVSHDVLMEIEGEVIIVAGTAGDVIARFDMARLIKNFESEKLDVITARNMRLNVDGGGTDVSDLTESTCVAIIDYTLEKITDADILSLLDIL